MRNQIQHSGPIDLHIHGWRGSDAQSHDPRELIRLARSLGNEGLAGFLLTYVSASRSSLLLSLRAARKAVTLQKRHRVIREAVILGVHLEGPFLNPSRAGAHAKRFLRPPSLSEVRGWFRAAGTLVKIVTLAPELPGAFPVIRFLVKNGVRVQMGHSGATAAQARKAQKAGITGITHLFNAMGAPDRRKDGIAEYALKDRSLYAELICDGVHVSDDLIRHTLKTRPLSKILLVSDCCAASGFPPGHRSFFAGGPAVTAPDGSVRRLDGALAASGLSLPKAIQRLRHLGVISKSSANIIGSHNPKAYL